MYCNTTKKTGLKKPKKNCRGPDPWPSAKNLKKIKNLCRGPILALGKGLLCRGPSLGPSAKAIYKKKTLAEKLV